MIEQKQESLSVPLVNNIYGLHKLGVGEGGGSCPAMGWDVIPV